MNDGKFWLLTQGPRDTTTFKSRVIDIDYETYSINY